MCRDVIFREYDLDRNKNPVEVINEVTCSDQDSINDVPNEENEQSGQHLLDNQETRYPQKTKNCNTTV